MANLLDRSSLVLTPTAYNNGEALCIKPDDGSGDFDFSRNSAATRVNAQGLVENVQILSSNLVQNGDFSEEGVQEVSNGSFSQEGVQLVTNGNFSNGSTDWILDSGWSVSDNKALCDGTNLAYITQTAVLTTGKSYKVQFDIVDYTSGSVKYRDNGFVSGQSFSGVGSYTDYVVAGGGQFRLMSENFIGSIDNVSVREVGQDWILGTNWSIGEDKAISDGTSGNLYQSGIIVTGKQYKIQATVSDYVSGNVEVSAGAVPRGTMSANGTYTFYQTASSTINFFIISNSFNGSITNISVKEVGQNWDLDTGWEIGNNLVTTDGAINSNFYQDAVTTIGQTYKYSFDVLNSGGGVIDGRFRNGGGFIQNFSSEGTYTGTFVAYNTLADFTTLSGNTASFSITNISVIEITDDTNLPRINYEGFSYQDALGSELITNGDFATDSDWNKQSGWIITNGYAESTALGTRSIFQNTGAIVIGKTYQVTYTILETNGSIFRINFGGVNGIGRYTVGTYTENIVATSTSGAIYLDALNVMIGKIDNVSVKEYLGQEVVPDSGCGSWLWEPQSTNLITQSELFSDASWVKINSSVVSGFASPSGNTNAYKLIASVSNTDHRTRTAPIATAAVGTAVTFSIYIKPQEITKIALVDNWTNLSYGVVNLTTNSVIEEAQGTTSVTEILNGFRRVSFTYQTANINTLPAVYLLDDAYTSGNPTSYTFASDGTSGVYIWGAQLEQQSYATSYIPQTEKLTELHVTKTYATMAVV